MKKENIPSHNSEGNSTPLGNKNDLNTGNSVTGTNEEDTEEFASGKKNSKKAAEAKLHEEEEREIRKANRISNSGVRDDDDDGTDATFEDDNEAVDFIGG